MQDATVKHEVLKCCTIFRSLQTVTSYKGCGQRAVEVSALSQDMCALLALFEDGLDVGFSCQVWSNAGRQ